METPPSRPTSAAAGRPPTALTPDRAARDDHGVARHGTFAGCTRFTFGAAGVRSAASLLLGCIVLLWGLLWCAAAPGQSEDDARADLDRVRARLESVAREIAQAYDERDALTEALARSETLAADIRIEIAGLDERLAATLRQAEATRGVRVRKRTELDERRDRLAHAVRASYRFARRNRVAMLLDLESPAEIDRMLALHTLVERAHVSMIRGIADTVAGLAALEAKAAEEAESIATLRDEKQHRLAGLERQRATRSDAIHALAERIRDRESRAAQLRADERRLVELIGALRAELSEIASKIRDDSSFEGLRGQLRWPVDGAMLARYGSPRGASDLTWQGVLIGAPAGKPVRSIHRGRVAYADWLRGFGLLLIIEHGDGFMSLYGHNETLIRETGDWVESGEDVATVGDSGGNPEPALYFEIRRAGKPVDPRRWCAGPLGS